MVPEVQALARQSGIPIELALPALLRVDAAVADAAYRVVQEGVTNAGKHGAGAARVAVGVREGTIEIVVSNPLPNRAVGTGGGAGLAGLRERVLLAGGALEAGADGTTWVLRARIPA